MSEKYTLISALFVLLAGCGSGYHLVQHPPVTKLPEIGPVAITGATRVAYPGNEVVLDGTASYDPDSADALSFAWVVHSQPEGSNVTLDGGDRAHPKLTADLVGTYDVDLLVTDSDGLESTNPATEAVDVVPWDDLQVTLTWDKPVDLDVHLVSPGGAYYADTDCFFGNPAPDWGDPGDASDDPRLDADSDGSTSNGPEDIELSRPEQGLYSLYVTYWNNRGLASPATSPTVVVKAAGQQIVKLDGPKLSDDGVVWFVGTLDWSTLAFVPTAAEQQLTTNAALGGPAHND